VLGRGHWWLCTAVCGGLLSGWEELAATSANRDPVPGRRTRLLLTPLGRPAQVNTISIEAPVRPDKNKQSRFPPEGRDIQYGIKQTWLVPRIRWFHVPSFLGSRPQYSHTTFCCIPSFYGVNTHRCFLMKHPSWGSEAPYPKPRSSAGTPDCVCKCTFVSDCKRSSKYKLPGSASKDSL